MKQTPEKNSRKKRTDPQELSRFVEELSWLLSSFEGIDYKALAGFSNEMKIFNSNSKKLGRKNLGERKTAILVGILPDFLMDIALFPSNEGIVEFADAALGLPINRWQKKSSG